MLILSHVCYFTLFVCSIWATVWFTLFNQNECWQVLSHKEAQRGFCSLLNFEFMHYLDSFTEFFQLHNSTEMSLQKHWVFMVVWGKMDLNMVQYGSLNKSNYLYVSEWDMSEWGFINLEQCWRFWLLEEEIPETEKCKTNHNSENKTTNYKHNGKSKNKITSQKTLHNRKQNNIQKTQQQLKTK